MICINSSSSSLTLPSVISILLLNLSCDLKKNWILDFPVIKYSIFYSFFFFIVPFSLLRTSIFPFTSIYYYMEYCYSSYFKGFVWYFQHLHNLRVGICWWSFLLKFFSISWVFLMSSHFVLHRGHFEYYILWTLGPVRILSRMLIVFTCLFTR